ncbi:hypothetical protein [Afipia broomeae]|jgi:hypothetical protein|uniref:Uncharacterized protein n=1 Tax=Afipia broomeae ATCC 49717 TaxID=883078 RepID=K8PHK3_9BRAD|nr:hypothetical protein [Afipia broomeae]EKS42142.1 hypothetical protein HMPREF9695_01234 [Afipia broomeae ATCC 49717]
MFAQLGAILAAVQSVVGKLFGKRFRTIAGTTATALALGGCMQTAAPLAGVDPADPNARVAAVGYRSTVAPYTSLRPTAPSSWREQNDRVAPAPKSGR